MASPHNIPMFARALLRMSQAIDFDSKFANRNTLAEDLQKTLAQRIIRRSIHGQMGPGMDDWKHLAPSTVAKKGHDVAGVETGEMLSLKQVMGRLVQHPREMAIHYGTTIRNARIARFFHYGTRQGKQPARPFFGLDQDDEGTISVILEARAERIIRRIDAMKGRP